ncbi:MAG: hypothetical protein HYU86_05570 [Chloroflexi bacterium]|nr:hypothetical protein [Chloroflexota bacterium]
MSQAKAVKNLPQQILLGLSLLFLTLYFLFFLYRSFHETFFPYSIDYHEPYLLGLVKLIVAGEDLYRDPNSPPYILPFYGPGYLWLVATLSRLFGTFYAVGRVISFASALFIGLVTFLVLRRETKSILTSTTATFLFFSTYVVYSFSPDYRVDFLGVALAFGGMYLLYRKLNSTTIFLSSLLLTFALFTKGPEIAAPVAAFIYIFLKKKTSGLQFGFTFAFLVLTIFFGLNYLTQGEFFFHNITVPLTFPTDVERLFKELYRLIIVHPVLLALALAYFIRQDWRKEAAIFSFWLIPNLVVTLRTTAVLAVGPNHFIELMALLCILFGLSFHHLWQLTLRTPQHAILSLLVPSLLLFQALSLFHAPNLPSRIQEQYFFYLYTPPSPYSQRAQERERVLSSINAAQRPVLSLDGHFTEGDADKEVEFGPDNNFIYLVSRGYWDPEPLQGKIRNKEYGLIISRRGGFWQLGMNMEDYYYVSDTTANYWLWKPKE